MFQNTGKQAVNGSPLVIVQCIPALEVKMLLRNVPRPPTLTYVLLTYVLLTYVLEIPDQSVEKHGYSVTSCFPP